MTMTILPAMGFVFTLGAGIAAGVLFVIGSIALAFLGAGLVMAVVATVMKRKGKDARGFVIAAWVPAGVAALVGAIPAVLITLLTHYIICIPFAALGVAFIVYCRQKKYSVLLPVLSLCVGAYFAAIPWIMQGLGLLLG